MTERIGIGYDVHRFVKGRKLFLGGVEIPHAKGLEGHSDADAVLHALCDAILGALGKGDIGEYFPDTDPRYKGISSLELLQKIYQMATAAGYRVANVDTIIIAQEPNIKNYKKQMGVHIARILSLKEERVNIKATTHEGLGCIGRAEGIAAQAAVLLVQDKRPKR